MNTRTHKIILTLVALLAGIAYLAVAVPAHASDSQVQTKLVSSYPCYAQYSPVMLLGRRMKADGTWGPWILIRTIDRRQNPNYPCATTPTQVRRGTYRIVRPNRTVSTKRLVRVEPQSNGRAYAYFNNGAVWSMRPCPLEDSERCWWDAGNVGNHRGHSFVRLFHHTYYFRH